MKKIKLSCLNCNTEFEKYPCQIGKHRGKYCSRECHSLHRRHGSSLNCFFCGTEFYRRFGEQKRIINQYCSKECYSSDRILKAKKTTYLKDNSTHIHILVAENALGRKLLKGEIVHHIDENKHNNNINNLAILPSQKLHAQIHFSKEKINFDKYILTNILKEKLNGVS